MSSPPKAEKPPISADEEQILLDNAIKQFQNLKKEDPRFIGIDLETKTYWVMGVKFTIKQLGFTAKKEISKIFDEHDDIVRQLGELDKPEDSTKRIGCMQSLDHAKDNIIEKALPIMLDDGKGFDTNVWFSDKYPAAVWWDVARDLYHFLRERGSKEDILRSMMQSA